MIIISAPVAVVIGMPVVAASIEAAAVVAVAIGIIIRIAHITRIPRISIVTAVALDVESITRAGREKNGEKEGEEKAKAHPTICDPAILSANGVKTPEAGG